MNREKNVNSEILVCSYSKRNPNNSQKGKKRKSVRLLPFNNSQRDFVARDVVHDGGNKVLVLYVHKMFGFSDSI